MISRTTFSLMLGCIISLWVLCHTNTALAGIGVKPTITELEIAPGDIKTGSFRVANGGEENTLVKVEVEDWLKMRIGKSPVDVEDWLIMDKTEFELEPQEVKEIGYMIVAPEGIEGELIAMVFFSSAVPGEGNLNITSRFGVAVYAGIEGTEVIDAEIEDIEIEDSKAVVVVRNRGNVHLRPSGKVIIKDSKDEFVDEINIPYSAVIFAGKSHRYPLNLNRIKLSSGDYNIEAIFDTGTVYEKSKSFSKTGSFYLE